MLQKHLGIEYVAPGGEKPSSAADKAITHTAAPEVARLIEQALEMGFYISFSGIVTFKNAADLRDVAQRVPLDRILIETDSPYLAPVPHRGKPNEPRYVAKVAEQLATLRNISVEAMTATSRDNFYQLFQAARG